MQPNYPCTTFGELMIPFFPLVEDPENPYKEHEVRINPITEPFVIPDETVRKFMKENLGAKEKKMKGEGKALGLCAHPYDVCTALALKETGAIITDGFGSEEGFWKYPCDAKTNVHFIAYANKKIRDKMEPAIQEAIENVWGIKPY